MTFKYKNVYINDASTVVGRYEKNGPLSSYFDKSYNDFYFNKKHIFEEKGYEKSKTDFGDDSLYVIVVFLVFEVKNL